MKPLDPHSIAKPGSPEHNEQVALFVWASFNFDKYPALRLLFAIPNGGERNIIVASNLKAEGCKSGVPDMFLPVARGNWHGLFIELKRRAGKGKVAGTPSDEQLKWISDLQDQGYGAVVCVGWESARDTLIKYLEWSN
jgi:hypothetical protein